MPYVKYCSVTKKRDPVKALIREYQELNKLSDTQLANEWGISRATCSKRFNELHSDFWLSDAKKICKKLGVPIEEFRNAVRY